MTFCVITGMVDAEGTPPDRVNVLGCLTSVCALKYIFRGDVSYSNPGNLSLTLSILHNHLKVT